MPMMKTLILPLLTLILTAACAGQAPAPTPTPDIQATVQAAITAAMPTSAPTAAAPQHAHTPATVPHPAPSPAVPTPAPTPTLALAPTIAPTPPPSESMKEMITQARPAVVRIDNGAGTGTGVIYDAQQQTAYIITNHHVTADAPRLTVTVNDAQTYTAKVLGADTQRDLALIAICCGDFHTLPFGDASQLQTGDEIIAIGYALALDGPATITRGIISAIRYAPEYQSDVIQTDAAINPGNSGGPMLSMDGEILGINTYILEQSGSGRPLEGLNFAISGTTVQQTIPALRRGQSRPTPAPTPTPAAGAEYTAFGPISGELWHNPANGHIETEYAQVNMADLLISATFINPYSASDNPWDYGFILRRSGAGPDSQLIEIIVTGQGRWTAASRRGQPGEAREIARGTLGYFDTAADGQNTLWFAALGQRGILFVNGEYIASLDLSEVANPGDLAVITGAYQGNEIDGAVTRFKDFQAIQLTHIHGPHHGELKHQPGFITQRPSGARSRDLAAEADFAPPPGDDWDYGFVIRSPQSERMEVIGITGGRQWFHQTRKPNAADYTLIASGIIPPENFRPDNNLLLIAFNQNGLFFINGILTARLDLSHNLNHGEINIMSGFFNTHPGEPQYRNFTVWTP